MESRTDLEQNLAGIRQALQNLERRLCRVEGALGIDSAAPVSTGNSDGAARPGAEGDDQVLEYKIGELWIGRAGVAALLMGIAFFISYPFGPEVPPLLQILVGYLAAGVLIAVSRSFDRSYPSTSRLLFAGGLILVYFSTLRLHFFSASPVVSSKPVGLALLVAVLGGWFYLSVVRRAQHLAVITLLLCFVTGLCSDTTHFALALALAAAGASVFLALYCGWTPVALVGLPLVYLSHLNWVLNNPLLGHAPGIVPDHHYTIVYLFAYGAVFGAAGLLLGKKADTSPAGVSLIFLNGVGFFTLSTFVSLVHFGASFAAFSLLVSVFLLTLAVAHWTVRRGIFSTALYACLGYMALSAGIIVHFGSPERFIWLGWQSLLVISTAIWFRSKIIVVANVLIYMGILLVYLFWETPVLAVNLSYAAVALLSARVMNWRKERLTLKTEAMRNLYLGSAFVIVPYGLYHGVPSDYVSLSWLGAALFYFALSLILKNRKYRWLAILTMFLTIAYVLIVDLSRLSPAFRVVSFLVLGLTMLGVSWMYARNSRRRTSAPGRETTDSV